MMFIIGVGRTLVLNPQVAVKVGFQGGQQARADRHQELRFNLPLLGVPSSCDPLVDNCWSRTS